MRATLESLLEDQIASRQCLSGFNSVTPIQRSAAQLSMLKGRANRRLDSNQLAASARAMSHLAAGVCQMCFANAKQVYT